MKIIEIFLYFRKYIFTKNNLYCLFVVLTQTFFINSTIVFFGLSMLCTLHRFSVPPVSGESVYKPPCYRPPVIAAVPAATALDDLTNNRVCNGVKMKIQSVLSIISSWIFHSCETVSFLRY